MFTPEQEHYREIRDAIFEFGVNDEAVYNKAYELFKQAVSHPELQATRTTAKSVIASVVYIAIRLLSDQDITQTDICYKFKVSPMTLRKQYSRICELLGIDRKDVRELKKADGDTDASVQTPNQGGDEPGEQAEAQDTKPPQD